MKSGLAGRRIVNTRAEHQAGALDNLLRSRGAVPVAYPCIAIGVPDDTAPLDAALLELVAGHYDWLILTSANTVLAVAQRLEALNVTLTGIGVRSAAVGPATAEAARERLGLHIPDLPGEYVAESLAASLDIQPGTRVLLPESAIARPTLASMLAARGAEVTVVTAYETRCGSGGADVPEMLASGQVDALTFTSSSTVTCFLDRLRGEGGQLDSARLVYAACIGPKTAETARECGFAVMNVPAEYTLTGLVDMLEDDFGRIIAMSKDPS